LTARLGIVVLGSVLSSAAIAADDGFDRLKTIAGDWQGDAGRGAALHLSYKPISRGSVLVELWQPGTRAETMTMFHRDGARVLATHYCAQGNQPRLAMHAEGDAFVFEYVDATNLPDAQASHLHRLVLAPQKDGSLERTETYRDHGRDETSRVRLHRSDAAEH
jgi:hypothetical protein